MDEGHSKGNPALSAHLAAQTATTTKLNSSRIASGDVIEVPQDIPIALHDVSQRLWGGGSPNDIPDGGAIPPTALELG